MRIHKAWVGGFLALVVPAALAATASAQVVSNIGNVSLNATLPQSVTVAVTSGSSVNFALTENTTTNGDVPAVIQTRWNLNPGQVGAVTLYGYFDVPAQALTDGGGNNIPTSWVEGQMATGIPTSYTAFTQTNPVGPAGGSLALFSANITGVNKVATRTDNLDLRINLTGQLLPASTYTGTLRIQARAL